MPAITTTRTLSADLTKVKASIGQLAFDVSYLLSLADPQPNAATPLPPTLWVVRWEPSNDDATGEPRLKPYLNTAARELAGTPWMAVADRKFTYNEASIAYDALGIVASFGAGCPIQIDPVPADPI